MCLVDLEVDGSSVMPFLSLLEETGAELFMLSLAYHTALVPLQAPRLAEPPPARRV